MKGRPPVIPRIEALERLYADALVRITQLENAVLELAAKATGQIGSTGYQPQFTQWPDVAKRPKGLEP